METSHPPALPDDRKTFSPSSRSCSWKVEERAGLEQALSTQDASRRGTVGPPRDGIPTGGRWGRGGERRRAASRVLPAEEEQTIQEKKSSAVGPPSQLSV